MFSGLANLADRRARRTTVIAVVLFMVAGLLGGSVAERLDPYGADDPASDTVIANELLTDAGHRRTAVVVLIEDVAVDTPAGRARLARVADRVRATDGVASVTGYRQSDNPPAGGPAARPAAADRAFVSRDGHSTYLAVALTPLDDKERQVIAAELEHTFAADPQVSIGGPAMAEEQVNRQVEKDLTRAELMAFPILFLLALLFFRSLVAALLPMMVGALSIIGTLFVLRLGSELGSISVYALNLTIGLGLGLAIDYSLFIVSRYREEIANHGPGLQAMRRTMATAGRTVFFSSLTVAAALASLLIFPQRYLYSMGIGGVTVALLSALIALTVLPAVLTLLGNRVNALAPRFLARAADRDTRPDKSGFWYRLSRLVMRRPVPIATICATALILLGIPFLGIKFIGVDAQVLPESASAKQVDDRLRAEFPPYRDTPIEVVVEGGGPQAVRAQTEMLRRLPGVSGVAPPRKVGADVTLISAYSRAPFLADSSMDTVNEVRDLAPPAGARVLVTGASAAFIDFQASLLDHLPMAVAIVVLSTLVILFLMTGSLILPFKALLMNVLNLAAVFGILVLIFQDGRLEGLLGYTSQGGIEQAMPILLFATGFGLATDYAVFLLSRIKEARDGGASERESVAIGLERTGRIVTAAALLFAIALGAFATSQIIFVKQTGVGIALAVLIDASIVRALLVPSLMEMLGKWNWWAPRPLRRLHDRFGISEVSDEGDGRASV